MKNGFFLTGFLLFSFLAAGVGEAFVPKAPHLLHLVIEKIKNPAGMEIFQTKKFINYDDSDIGLFEIEEKLIFLTPNHVRADVISGIQTSFSVESDFRFVRVKDGVTLTNEKSPVDLYTDILLYRDPESLLNQLALTGMDLSKVSFQRYNETICYVIGRPTERQKPFAGLWIEKETFFPIKYVVNKNGWVVEFYYHNWQRLSKSWYPMQVSVFLDNQLFCMIDVKSFDLKSDFSKDLFDIDYIEKLYPKKTLDFMDENSKQVEELNKRMEDFKKLYE